MGSRLAGGEDSYIGAIWELSDEEDDGEVVEEDGMFDMVYTGHCNKQGCKEVHALLRPALYRPSQASWLLPPVKSLLY